MRAFPTMLKGLAQDHFYNNQLSHHTYEEACTNIRNFFEGPGFHRRSLDQWNSTSLASLTAENPGNTTFRSTSVKPFHVLDVQVNDDDLELGQNNQGDEGDSVITKETPVPVNPPKRGKG